MLLRRHIQRTQRRTLQPAQRWHHRLPPPNRHTRRRILGNSTSSIRHSKHGTRTIPNNHTPLRDSWVPIEVIVRAGLITATTGDSYESFQKNEKATGFQSRLLPSRSTSVSNKLRYFG